MLEWPTESEIVNEWIEQARRETRNQMVLRFLLHFLGPLPKDVLDRILSHNDRECPSGLLAEIATASALDDVFEYLANSHTPHQPQP